MKQAVVTVTSQIVGKGEIYPYERHLEATQLPLYEVPQYLVDVDGIRQFKALRFGLHFEHGPLLKERVCDVGLFHAAVLYPSWVSGYSPHSFQGEGIRGAWRLKPGQQFLLHEGAGEQGTAGASLGCVELAGALSWNNFMHSLQSESGVTDFAEIARRKLLKVVIQAAAPPQAIYKRSYNIDQQKFFIAPVQ